jgi:HEAT repeat protein
MDQNMFHPIPMTDWLVQVAQHDADARKDAVERVHEVEPPVLAAVPTLARLLMEDPDPWVRIAAADELSTIEPVAAQAVSALLAGLKDTECMVRWSAAYAFYEIGPRTEEEVLVIVEAAHDPSLNTIALMALGESGNAGAAAVGFLVEALADRKQAEMAADALGSLGAVARQAAAPLTAALKADNVPTRRAAADALGSISPPTSLAVRALREAINDQEFYERAAKTAHDFMVTVPLQTAGRMYFGHPDYVRHASARALWRLGRHELAVPVLVDLLSASAGYVREIAVITLGQMGPVARRAVDRVMTSSGDPDAGVRRESIEALAKIGGSDQVPTIMRALDDDDVFVRMHAATVLGRFGREARSAITRLKRAAAEGASFDRLAASAALWQICRWPHTAAATVEALRSSDVDLRLAAVHAIGELPFAPKRTIAALESALNDDDRWVRRDAAKALAELEAG